MLDMKDEEMDINLIKFRQMFKKDLAFCASTGYCSFRMFATLRGVAALIMPDV